jgi:hypothetical protein
MKLREFFEIEFPVGNSLPMGPCGGIDTLYSRQNTNAWLQLEFTLSTQATWRTDVLVVEAKRMMI